MRSLRVAQIPYLNSVPYYAGVSETGLEMVDLHPRALGQAAAEGSIDAGLMSIADTFATPNFEPLGDLGIALDGPAHSVLLFSAEPIERLGGKTLGITGETSTSYPLLRLLLEDCYGIRPAAYVRRTGEAAPGDSGVLLIGDAALRRAKRSGLEPGANEYSGEPFRLDGADPFEEPFPHVLDLAAAWKAWQGLPFVFARWMVRRDVDIDARGELLELLTETLEDNLRRLDRLALEHAARAGLSERGAFAYLMGFTYQFGSAGEAGIKTFRNLLESTAWWEIVPPALLERDKRSSS
jgi:chorismate dehydratase